MDLSSLDDQIAHAVVRAVASQQLMDSVQGSRF